MWRAEHDHYNFVETPAEAHVAFPLASYQRLREIKARYDPQNLFRSTLNIAASPTRP